MSEYEAEDEFHHSAEIGDDGDQDDAAAYGVAAEAALDNTKFLWNRLQLVKDDFNRSVDDALYDAGAGGSNEDGILWYYATLTYDEATPLGYPIAPGEPWVNFYDSEVGDEIEIHMNCNATYGNGGNAYLRLHIVDDYETTAVVADTNAARAMIETDVGGAKSLHWVHTVAAAGRTMITVHGRVDTPGAGGLLRIHTAFHLRAERRRKALIDSADV